MLRFRQMKTLQKFSSVHASVHNNFNQERHLIDRDTYLRVPIGGIGRGAGSHGLRLSWVGIAASGGDEFALDSNARCLKTRSGNGFRRRARVTLSVR